MPQSIAPPLPGAPLQRRTIQIDFNGELLDFPWDNPAPPTKRDVNAWIQQRQAIPPPVATPTLANPLPSTPLRSDVGGVAAPTPAPEVNTFGSRARTFGEGLLGMPKALYESGFGNPAALLGNIIREGPEKALKAPRELMQGMVIDPAMDVVHGAMSPDPGGFTKGLLRGGTKFFGGDPDAITEDWQAGNYGALAGDILPPLALAGLGGLVTKGLKGAPKSTALVGEVLPALPKGQRLLGGRMGSPVVEQAPPRRLNAYKPEVTPIEGVPTYEGPRQITSTSLGDRKPYIPAPERLQLPAVGETTNVPSRQFVAGERGVVDTSLDYPVDLADPAKLRGNPITPEDVMEIMTVRPDLTKNQIIAMLNERGTLTAAELGEVGSLNPVDVAAGTTGRNIAQGFPLDRAQANPVFDALIPDRLKAPAERIMPTEPALGLRGMDVEAPILEHRLGGEIVNPPPPIPVPSGIGKFNYKTLVGEEARPFRQQRGPAPNIEPFRADVVPPPEAAMVRRAAGRRETIPPVPKVGPEFSPAPKVYPGEARLEPTRTNIEDPNIQYQLRDVGGDNNVLETAKKSAHPEIQDAARRAEVIIRQSAGTRIVDDIATGGMEVVRKAGKAGAPLADMITKGRLDGEALGSKWKVAAEQATKGLTPEQVDMYVEARDTGVIPNDPAVKQALKLREIVDTEVVDTMKQTGAGLRTADGKVIPFRERLNHWPHIYPKEFFANKATAMEAMMRDGMSPEQASEAIRNASRFGERIISPLNERQTNAPGYSKKLEADYKHLQDMGKRAVEARDFGPLDIADPGSPISQLLAKTDDPARIREIVSKHLNRDLPETTTKDWSAFSRGVVKLQTAMHLSQFAISNISQLANTPLRGNLRAYGKALWKTATDFKNSKGEAEGTGALQTIHHDILREVGGGDLFPRIYGMKTSETINRTVAALTGKGTAEQLFKTVKSDPVKHTRAKARLQNLLLEDIDQVVKQDKLTQEQLARAGGRMSEITQGRAEAIDLPPMWSKHPATEMLLLYKKYAFRQTKIIADAIKENPKRNIPLAMGLYSIVGELVGDTKAAISGTVSGEGAGNAIAARGDSEFLQGIFSKTPAKYLGRLAANLGQAWALGILANVVGSVSEGQYGMLKEAAGPIVGDTTEALSAAFEAAPKPGPGKSNLQPATKKLAKSVPFIGTGLAKRVTPNRPPRKNPFGLGAVSTPNFGLPQR